MTKEQRKKVERAEHWPASNLELDQEAASLIADLAVVARELDHQRLEAEAARRKAEWQADHERCCYRGVNDIGLDHYDCFCENPERETWNLAQWVADQAKREVERCD